MREKYITENELVNASFKIGMAQHKEEILGLTEFLAEKNLHNVIEIGSKLGGTFNILCNISTGKRISIDLPGGIHGGWMLQGHPYMGDVYLDRNAFFNMRYPNVHMITGDSHKKETVNEVTKCLDGELADFLFIDGDHTYEGVKQDWLDYKHFVKPGGWIAFHDINDTEQHRDLNVYVGKLWDELGGNKVEFNVHKDWGGIGVVQV